MMKAVVFDVDGVLTHFKLFSDRYTEKFGVPWEILSPFFQSDFQNCVIGLADLKSVLPKYVKRWQWKGSIKELIDYWLSEDSLDINLLQYINRLKQKGIRVYIGSNQEQYRAGYIRVELGMKEVFEETFFSCEFGVKKPGRTFFLKVFNKVKKRISHLKKDQVLFVDDEEENIRSASALGFKAHHYKSFNRFKKQIAQYMRE